MPKRTSILSALVLASAVAAGAASAPVALVICAPGYPGSTTEAQPSMDTLAAAVAKSAGWPPAQLTAAYYETEDAGVARLKAPPAATALVPLPFFLSHEGELKLKARAQAVEKDGEATVTWTLVAKKGRVTSPASLSGGTIASLAGYAPAFVRNVALASWGKLPPDVNVTATSQVLSALRKAASGENIAVLLDASQAKSLPTLPFAADLEIVTKSPPVPGILVCTVGDRLPAKTADQLLAGLLKMDRSPEGASALDAVRLARFVPLDSKGLDAARRAFGAAATKTP